MQDWNGHLSMISKKGNKKKAKKESKKWLWGYQMQCKKIGCHQKFKCSILEVASSTGVS